MAIFHQHIGTNSYIYHSLTFKQSINVFCEKVQIHCSNAVILINSLAWADIISFFNVTIFLKLDL